MTGNRTALRILHLVLGVVLAIFSAQLVIAQLHAPHHSHLGTFLLVLGVVETVAAVLFLVPATFRLGAAGLLAAFAVAAVFHGLHGQWNTLGSLAIYAAGVLAVLTAGG